MRRTSRAHVTEGGELDGRFALVIDARSPVQKPIAWSVGRRHVIRRLSRVGAWPLLVLAAFGGDSQKHRSWRAGEPIDEVLQVPAA
eukprot:scaffold441_cov241-Pinguiococcus_pyrenoidosus.AAC.7